MNKILKRITGLTLGLSLLAGVGVALANHKEVSEVSADSGTWTLAGVSTNGTAVGSNYATGVGGITFSGAQGGNGTASNVPKWYSTGGEIRVYQSNDITFSISSGTISAISFTYPGSYSNLASASTGTLSNGSWTGEASSVTFRNGSSAQTRFTAVTFTYTTSGGGGQTGHAGTATDPFTVAEGIAKCKENGTTAGGPWVVRGIISKVDPWDSGYTNITYWISEDGTGTDDKTKTIECFRSKYVKNANVTSSNYEEFSVGKIVTVTGNLVYYKSSTPEFAQGCYPLSIEAPAETAYTVTCNIAHASLSVSEVYEGHDLTVSIIPEIGYLRPTSLTSVKAGGVSVAYTYENGVLTVENVQGNIVIEGTSGASCNPIRSLYDWPNNNMGVEFYAYYVGFLDGSGPVVMDGEYGVLLFKSNQDVSGWTEQETILHIKSGKTSWYNGLLEVASYTVEVVESANVSTPVVYAAQGGETQEYESRLTTVSGVPIVTKGDVTADAGTADITLSFTIGEHNIQVFYKKAAQLADTDAYDAVQDAVANSESITIKGFTGWYNGFQVQMNGYVPASESYTAEAFAQDLLDQTDAVCENYDGVTSNHDALVAIWSNLASNDKYPSLPADQKTILAEADRDESGTVIEQAMARYDYLTGKYNLSNFINGRTPVSFQQSRISELAGHERNTSTVIIIVIAVMSATSMGVLIAIKRKRLNVK